MNSWFRQTLCDWARALSVYLRSEEPLSSRAYCVESKQCLLEVCVPAMKILEFAFILKGSPYNEQAGYHGA